MRQWSSGQVIRNVVRSQMALAACLALVSTTVMAQGATRIAPLDTTAINALRRMGSYLRGLAAFTVEGQTLQDEMLPNGQYASVAGTLSYIVRPPDRLRAEIRTDRKQRQLFYDGKTLTIYAPRMQYYASAPAPATILATMDSARKRYEVDFPLADLFLWGTPRDGIKDLTAASYVGPAYVDGVDTDQYIFREPGADWQLWIQRGNTPFPRRIVITTTSNSAKPRYLVTMHWNTTPILGDAVFAFSPPKGAQRIVLASTGGAVSASGTK